MTSAIPVRNPRSGAIDYRIMPPSLQELDTQCESMRVAQHEWLAIGLDGRIAQLLQFRDRLVANSEPIVTALTLDTGRRPESELELDLVVKSIERWCGLAPNLLAQTQPRTAAIPFIQLHQEQVPYGLVGVISPWNFPLLLAMIDTLPALLAGCALLVKPSEITPRFIEPLQTVINQSGRLADVFKLVSGAGPTGEAMIDRVDLVCFTGSVSTGRRVAEACAKQFIPAFLEMGGKDPAIVMAEADLELASSALLWGSVVNAGQSCLSIERIYVDQRVHDELVTRLVDKATAITLAHPEADSGHIGPIIAERQADVISQHLRDALDLGATIVCGGFPEIRDGGLFCRPTVLTGVDHRMLLMTEETFGPIMPVMPFRDEKEAIALANATPFGLSAAVFHRDNQHALALGKQIHAGAISINDAALTAMIHEAEKHAFKLSGMGGSRMGPGALTRFTRRQSLMLKTDHRPDPWWFS